MIDIRSTKDFNKEDQRKPIQKGKENIDENQNVLSFKMKKCSVIISPLKFHLQKETSFGTTKQQKITNIDKHFKMNSCSVSLEKLDLSKYNLIKN